MTARHIFSDIREHSFIIFFVFCLMVAGFLPNGLKAGENDSRSLNLGIKGYGISIGNSARFNGLRINFRDSGVERINGINITLWKARQNNDAVVNGISLGLVSPEAGVLRGIQIGGIGVAAQQEISGVSLALIGVGAQGEISGITIAGIGAGSEGSLKGVIIGGIGAGSGSDITGLAIAGIGVGAQKNIRGIIIGGVGAGAGENIEGIAIGGIGAGAGGDINGISVGLVGVGAAGNMTGLHLGGLGVGGGKLIKGVAIGGLGVGAPRVNGLVLGGLGIGATEFTGIALSAGRVKINKEGLLKGISVSAFNHNLGRQQGIALGIFNYARQLRGVQIGVLNYVQENPSWRRLLPVLNFN